MLQCFSFSTWWLAIVSFCLIFTSVSKLFLKRFGCYEQHFHECKDACPTVLLASQLTCLVWQDSLYWLEVRKVSRNQTCLVPFAQFSDATFPEISGIPDIRKSICPIRKPSGNLTNREFLLNEVVRSQEFCQALVAYLTILS